MDSGYFYEIGMYVPVDLQEAKSWYAKAAAHGNKDASNRIEGISRSKTLSKKDHENIALSKIRARHASQRSKVNPITERQRAASAQMPSVAEAVDMPDPTIPQDYPPPMPSIPTQHQFPPRGSSATPVNTSFINPEILAGAGQNQGGYLRPFSPQSSQRPGSVAPYPLELGPMNGNMPFPPRSNSSAGYAGPGPQGRPFSPPGPYSALLTCIFPYSYANSVLAAGFYPPGNAGPGPQRPFTAAPGDNRGPNRTPHPIQPPNAMGPPPIQHYPPHPQQPQNRPPPHGQQYPGVDIDAQQKRLSGNRPTSSGTPKPPPPVVDIGFEAPPPPKPKPAPTPKPVQAPLQQPPPQKFPVYQPPSAAATPVSPAPPKPQPPPVRVQTPKPAPAPAKAGKAGKGPKTFEEMGVAESKKEEECVSRLRPLIPWVQPLILLQVIM